MNLRFVRIRKGALLVVTPLCGVYLWSVAFPLKIPQPEPNGSFTTSYMQFRGSPSAASWIALDELPTTVACAVVKAEDRAFFRHLGIDWRSVFNALRQGVAGGPLIGASTISQQLARNLFLTPERTVKRKLSELWFTFRLEQAASKHQLLQLYLNSIEWGDGVWGIRRASQHYFGVDPTELTLEATLYLASRIANPLGEPVGEELNRMESVYRRVNWQLERSGLIPHDRREAADSLWTEYRRAVQRDPKQAHRLFAVAGSRSAGKASILDCGLAQELASVDIIKTAGESRTQAQ